MTQPTMGRKHNALAIVADNKRHTNKLDTTVNQPGKATVSSKIK